jgi:hypothetical protein
MNVEEAKLILQACRPGDEAGADPQLAAAQALLRSDPVPPDLQAQILARSADAKVITLPDAASNVRVFCNARGFSWRTPQFWAMAAVILIFLGLSVQWLRPHPVGPWAEFARDMITSTPHDEHHVDLKNSDLQQVRGWLAAHHGPADLGLPPVICNSPGLMGCRVTDWHGRPVSMLCFIMPGEHHVDLFVTPAGAITDVPDPGRPVFAIIAGQMTVAWRAGANVYLLTGRVPEDFLRHCLYPSAGIQAARPVVLGTVY